MDITNVDIPYFSLECEDAAEMLPDICEPKRHDCLSDVDPVFLLDLKAFLQWVGGGDNSESEGTKKEEEEEKAEGEDEGEEEAKQVVSIKVVDVMRRRSVPSARSRKVVSHSAKCRSEMWGMIGFCEQQRVPCMAYLTLEDKSVLVFMVVFEKVLASDGLLHCRTLPEYALAVMTAYAGTDREGYVTGKNGGFAISFPADTNPNLYVLSQGARSKQGEPRGATNCLCVRRNSSISVESRRVEKNTLVIPMPTQAHVIHWMRIRATLSSHVPAKLVLHPRGSTHDVTLALIEPGTGLYELTFTHPLEEGACFVPTEGSESVDAVITQEAYPLRVLIRSDRCAFVPNQDPQTCSLGFVVNMRAACAEPWQASMLVCFQLTKSAPIELTPPCITPYSPF